MPLSQGTCHSTEPRLQIYHDMIAKAAAEMRSALATAPLESEITLWAVHTTEEHDGFLSVGTEPPAVPHRRLPANIRPCDNHASGYFKWAAVPYSAIQQIMYQACRREPILPLDRSEQRPKVAA